jgi:hypothetical protein
MTGMERIELVLLVGSAAVVTVVLTIRRIRRDHLGLPGQVLIGLVTGAVAGAVVLALQIDLIPDELEAAVLPFVVVALTAAAAWGTWYRLARE